MPKRPELLTRFPPMCCPSPHADAFLSRKRCSYLINASRGSVVDLGALAAALRSGHVAGAAVDVYPSEPEGNGGGFATGAFRVPF